MGQRQAAGQAQAQEQQHQADMATQKAQMEAQMAQQQAQAQAAGAAKVDVTAELQKLAQLHQSGVLSDQEFAAAKQKLLS
jgi:multidrug resistance efflux pump